MSNDAETWPGTGDFRIGNCRATFSCPKHWSALTATDDADVRACGSCHQKVFRCRHIRDVAAHVKEGHCIAVAGAVSREAMFLGKMETDYQPGESGNERQETESLPINDGDFRLQQLCLFGERFN